MLLRAITTRCRRAAWAAAAGACLVPAPVLAQDNPQTPSPRQADNTASQQSTQQTTTSPDLNAGRQRIAGQAESQNQSIQTGDGMLAIAASLPAQVRIGEQFTYEVTVENTTDNVTLHQVELRHDDQGGINIESIESRSDANQPKEIEQAAKEKTSDQQSGDQASNDQSRDGMKGSSQKLAIDSLRPGESRVFQVSASVDQEGPVQACLMVTNYRPAICLQTTAIKPELKIVKESPEQNKLCEVIELTYTVTNDGTGAVGKFEIVDELSDGLRTIDDQSTLAFAVDELQGGDTRKFLARVYATKTGDFRSRAHARAVNSELSARSEEVGPEVVGADLNVNVQGRGAVPSNTPAVFTATITNTGNAAAEAVEVTVHIPQDASLRRMSDVQIQAADATAGVSARVSSAQQEPASQDQAPQNQDVTEQSVAQKTDAGNQDTNDSGNANAQDNAEDSQSESQSKMRVEALVIDRLEPGQSAQFDYVVQSRNVDRIETRVEAQAVCQFDPALDIAHDASSHDSAIAATRIIRLPGLQVFVLDDADPVEVGSPITYTIRVMNEGDAADENIRITATLPEQLTMENADGPTEHSQEGAELSFEPIDQLGPGEEVKYTVTATADSAGPAQLKVQLVSAAFSTPVETSEPTLLHSSGNGSGEPATSDSASGSGQSPK